MGNPRFYYYPDEAGSLETIDLGEGLTDLVELPGAVVEDAASLDGYPYRSFLRDTFGIRIVLERFGSSGTSSLERKFATLQSHLGRGGLVGFSKDHSKTWAAIRTGSATRGDPLFQTPGNGFTAWAPAGTLASGDEIAIESPAPDSRREYTTISALSSTGDLTLVDALRYTYDGHPIARYRDFYPVCWLSADGVSRPIVVSDHRRNWTLDLTLEYLPAATAALWGADFSSPYGRIVGGRGGGSMTMLRDDGGGRSGSTLEGAFSNRVFGPNRFTGRF